MAELTPLTAPIINSSVPLTASSIVHMSKLLYVSSIKITTTSTTVTTSIKTLPIPLIVACAARTISSFVCIARYRGKVCRVAAPFASPEHAESILERREAAMSVVEERLAIRWAIVRIRGMRAGERVVRSNRGARVRWGRSRVPDAAGGGGDLYRSISVGVCGREAVE